MSKILLKGGNNLSGSVKISGSKNACLPILAASLLFKNGVRLKNIPNISDASLMIGILNNVGVKIEFHYEDFDKSYINLDTSSLFNSCPKEDMVDKMRASILLLAPVLARFGKAKIHLPGGCNIGARPIDIHVECLRKMGAEIKIEDNYVVGLLKDNKFIGCEVDVLKSVGATENIITAAVVAKGRTVIKNPALEPEISSMCEMLKKAGAKIEFTNNEIIIDGVEVDELKIDEFEIPADRIEAGTYACIGALRGNDITLTGCKIDVFDGVLELLKDIGIGIEGGADGIKITRLVEYKKNLVIKTGVFPDFLPTDLQAQVCAYLLSRDGEYEIEENVFENRLMHVEELNKLGAGIKFKDQKTIVINGSRKLSGGNVNATDLRASAGLIIAGLMTNEFVCIDKIYHLDRGYEVMDVKLKKIGCFIDRVR